MVDRSSDPYPRRALVLRHRQSKSKRFDRSIRQLSYATITVDPNSCDPEARPARTPDASEPMSRYRRTFLAAAGAVAVAGCAVPGADPTVTDDRDSTADRGEGRAETTIGFAGDTMLGRELNRKYGRSDVDPATIWGDLRPRLESLDGVCCNLECCLSTRGEPVPGRSYHFRGDPEWRSPR